MSNEKLVQVIILFLFNLHILQTEIIKILIIIIKKVVFLHSIIEI